MSIPSDGYTSGGALLSAHRKLPVAASPPPPTGAHSSKLTGTRSTITARWSTSMSSIASSAVLLHTSTTNNIMRKIKITVTINMEHMSPDEQMLFFIRLADEGLLPPCPPEIRKKYEKPENV